MNILGNYNGIKIQVIEPHKVYRYEIVKAKRKSGPKLQKIRIFDCWCEYLTDGQVIEDKQRGIFMMNATTKIQFDLAIANRG